MATLTTCTSSTRPGSPNDGDMLYETDTQKIILYDAILATWKLFEPSVVPYALDGSTTMGFTPNFHFDVAKINGVDASNNPANGEQFNTAVSNGSGGTWTSRSTIGGTTLTASQSLASAQPTFYTAGTNSQPYFDYNDDYINIDQYFTNWEPPFSDKFICYDGPWVIFWVTQSISSDKRNNAGAITIEDDSVGGSQQTVHFQWTNSQDYLWWSVGGMSKPNPTFASGVGNGSTAVATSFGVTRLYLIVRNTSGEVRVYWDGNNKNDTLIADAEISNMYFKAIGFATSYTTNGEFYELAAWSADMSNDDLNKLVDYANTKYGVGRNADDTDDLARATF